MLDASQDLCCMSQDPQATNRQYQMRPAPFLITMGSFLKVSNISLDQKI